MDRKDRKDQKDQMDQIKLIPIDIEEITIEQRNELIKGIEEEMVTLSEIWGHINQILEIQKDYLDIAHENIKEAEIETELGEENLELSLEKSRFNFKKKLKQIRNISIVVGGGILGLSGFLLGPTVGVSTTIGGILGGSAIVLKIK